MITKLQIDKAVSKILYSVIEKGVCRIVTCQQPQKLIQVKSVYIKNLPIDHTLLWLPGNIDSIEKLSQTLSAVGIPIILPCCERQELIQQIRDYLVLCQQQGRLEIWIFENADLLSSEIYQLLGELVNYDYSDKALFSFELWGGAQLDVIYHSGQLQACCCAQYYYIPVGDQVLLAANPKLPYRAIIACILVFVLGISLGYKTNTDTLDNTVNLISSEMTGFNVEPVINEVTEQTPLLIADQSIEKAVEQASKATVEKTPKLIINNIAGILNEPVAKTVIGQTFELSFENTSITSHSMNKSAPIIATENNKHWFDSLSYPQWREKYQIRLLDDIDRQDGLFYLQLGIYRHQESLSKFFNLNIYPAQVYYFCYLEKDKIMALITGTFTSAPQAYDAHRRLLIQGLESSVVAVTKYNQWQCSTS